MEFGAGADFGDGVAQEGIEKRGAGLCLLRRRQDRDRFDCLFAHTAHRGVQQHRDGIAQFHGGRLCVAQRAQREPTHGAVAVGETVYEHLARRKASAVDARECLYGPFGVFASESGLCDSPRTK